MFAATVGRDHDYHQLAIASECWAELERERFSDALALCQQVLIAWQSTLSAYAQRLGVALSDVV